MIGYTQQTQPDGSHRMHDDLVGTTTDDDSWKVKRLRITPRVELTPSDAKGNVVSGIEPLSGSAKIIDNNDEDYPNLEAVFILRSTKSSPAVAPGQTWK